MTDAINAKSDVLGERELDAVSGGLLCLPLVAVTVRPASKGGPSPSDLNQKQMDALDGFGKALRGGL
jgi:hypothetical protein